MRAPMHKNLMVFQEGWNGMKRTQEKVKLLQITIVTVSLDIAKNVV